MIEALIYLLIKICIIALVIYLVLWVLEIVGIPIPAKVIQILWIIVALICILWLLQSLPGLGIRKIW